MSRSRLHDMHRLRNLTMGALVLLGIVGTGVWQFYRTESAIERNALDVVKDFPIRDPRNEESGLCPWREPEADRQRFFPEYPAGSVIWRDATLILTHDRPLLARLLGREPTAQENAIQIHRLSVGKRPVGSVITRCIAGESGLIELVLALEVDTQGKAQRVRGARLQRLREPEEVARILYAPTFLGRFRGKTSRSDWRLGRDIPEVPDMAVPSARAILEGARSTMILLSVGEQQLHHL